MIYHVIYDNANIIIKLIECAFFLQKITFFRFSTFS